MNNHLAMPHRRFLIAACYGVAVSPTRNSATHMLVPAKQLLIYALFAFPVFGAFPNGFAQCKAVTTSASMVSGTADLVNYPLTVVLTDNDLRTVANGGLVNSSSAFDIGFYTNCSDGATPLKWEIESYSPISGSIVAHVLRPVLSHTTNDSIGMFYGGAFSSLQSLPSAVWDANFKGVYHLGDGTTLSPSDSTANGMGNGTVVNSVAAGAGKIGGGGLFVSASSRYINLANTNTHLTTITVEAWINGSSFPAFVREIVSKGYDGKTAWELNVGEFGAGKVEWSSYDGSKHGVTASAATLSTGTWNHIVGTYDGSHWILYINGSQDSSVADAVGPQISEQKIYIGAVDVAEIKGAFDGAIDEVRISNVARNADWILTEYRNQSAPATYISLGARVSASGVSTARHQVRGGI
jgi:hypothetical protein